MSNRMKEEDRIERIIRNLLKLPENRRCINCNSLGPQYVCTTFWTFVCTTCSGVHREFTHRVKSVSMAKFNAEEVSALQAGGNERARQIYFKEWDLQLHSFPDGSNQNRLWDFIKHVYVDRKFTGYRCKGKLAMGAKEDFSDRCSFERPSTGGRIDDRNSKYYNQERKSPRNKPDTIRSVSKNHPVYFEVVDDRFRDDGFLSGRRNETHRSSTAKSRTRSGSPVSQKSRGKISPPVMRPVSELLGPNVPHLQVGGSPNERRDNDSSGHSKSWTSSSVHNAQASSSASAEKSSQSNSEATQDGMKELPEDLFTSSYSSFPAPAPGWQVRPLHGLGFHMQYYSTAMPVPAFPNSAKSRNPFDISNDGTEAQVPMFPSMLPVQGALPNLPSRSASLHTLDPHSPLLMQPQASPYGSIAAPQLPYGMPLAPVSGAFHEQESHSGLPLSRPPKINTRSKDAFASLNPIQQHSSVYPATTTPNSFSSSSGRNAFG